MTMETMKRTATCGALKQQDIGTAVVLNGWVHRNRDHGGVHFVDLRDRYGITQVVIDSNAPEALRERAARLGYEYCIAISGTVRGRPEEMVNPNMPTGTIEVAADRIEVLSASAALPFMVTDNSDAKEDTRLRYRYLDLRTARMQRNIKLRHDVSFAVREYLHSREFYEIETPTLIRSTPEGARDFVVPSRIHPGRFYALPQSPQLLKQILMVSGFDKYFQIARCYRDEDARGDRQPEFTQIDIEMSFVSQEEVFEVTEGMMAHVFEKAMGLRLETPFPRITYRDAMERFGSDKPDIRFAMEMSDFAEFVPRGEFKVFKSVLESGGTVKALVAPGAADYSRKQISELEETAKIYGAKGLAWMKVTTEGLDGGISKFFDGCAADIVKTLNAAEGDLILLVGDSFSTACESLGAVRKRLGSELGLVDESTFEFCWIVDFPLFEWNEDEEKWDPAHHMFSMPKERFLDSLEEDPASVTGDVYDLVCNGNELASGSIRCHDPEIQRRIFDIVGFSQEEAQERFGFLLEAFKYGPPPHGGIAPGLDRLVMIMSGSTSIREVIPFPKNTVGASPMDGSPSGIDATQLEELHIELVAIESEDVESEDIESDDMESEKESVDP